MESKDQQTILIVEPEQNNLSRVADILKRELYVSFSQQESPCSPAWRFCVRRGLLLGLALFSDLTTDAQCLDTLNPFLPRQRAHVLNIVCLVHDFHAHKCFNKIFEGYQSFRSPMLVDNDGDVLMIREKMFEHCR